MTVLTNGQGKWRLWATAVDGGDDVGQEGGRRRDPGLHLSRGAIVAMCFAVFTMCLVSS